MIVVFGLHDGNRIVRTEVKHIVGFLRSFTNRSIALEADHSVGQLDLRLHRDGVEPPFLLNGRRDELKLDVFFRHFVLGKPVWGHILPQICLKKRTDAVHLNDCDMNIIMFIGYYSRSPPAFQAIRILFFWLLRSRAG